jgi:hypothetical protein
MPGWGAATPKQTRASTAKQTLNDMMVGKESKGPDHARSGSSTYGFIRDPAKDHRIYTPTRSPRKHGIFQENTVYFHADLTDGPAASVMAYNSRVPPAPSGKTNEVGILRNEG